MNTDVEIRDEHDILSIKRYMPRVHRITNCRKVTTEEMKNLRLFTNPKQSPFQMEFSTFFHNGFNRDVTIVFRSGATFIIRPEKEVYNGVARNHFTIYQRINWNELYVNPDMSPICSDVYELDPNLEQYRHNLKAVLKDKMLPHLGRNTTEYNRQWMDCGDEHKYKILVQLGEREIGVHGGKPFYLPDFDIMVRVSDDHTQPIEHPLSDDASIEWMIRDHQDRMHRNENIVIVNNGDEISPRFVNYHGFVGQISPIKDPTRADGLYHVRPLVNENGDRLGIGSSKHVIECKYMTLEDAEKRRLIYRTKEDALTYGDGEFYRKRRRELLEERRKSRDELRKRKMETLKQQTLEIERVVKRETDERTHAMEMEKAQLEFDLSKWKSVTEKEREKNKDHHEQKSHQRKAVLEILKWVPAVLGAIVTCWSAWVKLTKAAAAVAVVL